jgi:hypothetical protein
VNAATNVVRKTLRKRLWLGVVATGLAAATAASAFGAAVRNQPPSAPAACSKATAKQVVNQHDLNHFALPNPVHQLLCGPFTGPGSQAMAVAIQAPTCWPVQHWAVFTFSAGSWRLVHEQPAYLHPPLVRAGSGIRETTAVQRPGDSRCNPSGGKRSRIWRWNGSRLVAGPWKTEGERSSSMAAFFSPSRNLFCTMGDHGQRRGAVICVSRKPEHRVGMGLDGRLDICRGAGCIGNPGVADPQPTPRLLAYGRQKTVGRFRCRSEVAGVTCVVSRTGKGFLINRDGVTRVG